MFRMISVSSAFWLNRLRGFGLFCFGFALLVFNPGILDAAELSGLTLSSQSPEQLTVTLHTDHSVTVETETTPTGQVLHLKQAGLSDQLKQQGLPLVKDSANRFIGRVEPDGASGVKVVLPNVPNKAVIHVVQTHKPLSAGQMGPSISPVLGTSPGTQQALQGQFSAAAKAAIAKVKQSPAYTAESSGPTAMPSVASTNIPPRSAPLPDSVPPPRYNVSSLKTNSRITHITLPSSSRAKASASRTRPVKTSSAKINKSGHSSPSNEKSAPQVASSDEAPKRWVPVSAQRAVGALPEVVPLVAGPPIVGTVTGPYGLSSPESLLQQAPSNLIPNYPGPDWPNLVQSAPLARVVPPQSAAPQKQIHWYETPVAPGDITVLSGDGEGMEDWSTENPYGLVTQPPEGEYEQANASSETDESMLSFMDRITGNTFSKPYGVAFWGIVIVLACLACLGFFALAVGALCARLIMSPPSVGVSPLPFSSGASPAYGYRLPAPPQAHDPLSQKYLSPSEPSSATQTPAATMRSAQAQGMPMGNPTSLYATSPIARQVSATQKKSLMRQTLSRPPAPTNVASAIEDALRLKL